MKTAAFYLAVICMTSAFAEELDHWEVNGSSMSDGLWTFSCTRGGAKITGSDIYWLTVGSCTAYPDAISTLDFGKPLVNVTSGDTKSYAITSIQPGFNGSEAGQRVGILKLPTHGFNFNIGNYYGGGRAFQNCTNLVSVVPFLPTNCTDVGAYCFSGCVKLASPLKIVCEKFYPSGTQWGHFEKTAIPSADLENSGIRYLDRMTFGDCANLEWVKLPKTLTDCYTGTDAFVGCSSLRRVDFYSVPKTLNVFGGRYALTDVHFHHCYPTNLTATTVFSTAAQQRTLTTWLHLDDSETEALAAWAAQTEQGFLSATSTWASASLNTLIDKSLRPLRRYVDRSGYHIGVEAVRDADEGTGQIGYFRFFRAEDDKDDEAIAASMAISGTAVNGRTYRTIFNSVQIPAGKRSVKLMVHPLFDEEITSDSTVILTLGGTEGSLIANKTTATVNIKNGATYGGWRVSSSTMTDGKWTFKVSRRGTTTSMTPETRHLWVQACTAWPEDVSTLDFAKAICDATADNRNYEFQDIYGPLTTDSRPKVGEVRLPSNGVGLYLDSSLFQNCTNLVSIVPFLPEECSSVGRGAFQNCSALTNALTFYGKNFGNNIGSWEVCKGCERIPSADFSQSTIKSLYRDAFVNCPALKWVKLPPTCTELGAPYSGDDLSDRTPFGGTGQNIRLIITGEGQPYFTCGLTTVGAVEFTENLKTLPDNAFVKYRSIYSSPNTKLNAIVFAGPPPENIGTNLFGSFTPCTITNYYPNYYRQQWREVADDHQLSSTAGTWTSGTKQLFAGYGNSFPGFFIIVR